MLDLSPCPKDVVATHFDEIRYLEEHPDVARRVREAQDVSGFDHFIKFGIGEQRRIFLSDASSAPLLMAAFLLNSNQEQEVQSLYHKWIGPFWSPSIAGRTESPRFAIYSGHSLLAAEFDCLAEGVAPHPARLAAPLDPAGVWRLAAIHQRLDTGELTANEIELLLSVAISQPRAVCGTIQLGVAHHFARTASSQLDPCILVRSILLAETYHILPRITALRDLTGHVLERLRHIELLELFRTGQLVGLAELVDGDEGADPFARMLQCLADLEYIERVYFTDRGVKCRDTIERLRRTLPRLDRFRGRSVLLGYITARLDTLVGDFETAAVAYRQILDPNSRAQFPHGASGNIENLMHAAMLGEAESALLESFVHNPAPEIVQTLGYIRHWLDDDHDLFSYVDELDSAPTICTPLGQVGSAVEARIHGAPIADHDFSLSLRIYPLARNRTFTVLRNEKDFVFAVDIEGPGLYLRIGDGTRWLEWAYLANIRPEVPIGLKIYREGYFLYAYIDGVLITRLTLARGFWLQGETYVAHYPAGTGDPVLAKLAMHLAIVKYPAGRPPERVVFVSMFWGDDYADMFNRTSVPSLLGLGELGRIAREFPVTFEVYLPGREARLIGPGLKALSALPLELRVYPGFVGDDPVDNRLRVGDWYSDVWTAHERENCISINAQPDHVFGRGLLGVLKEFEANQYVISGHPRIAEETGLPALALGFASGTLRDNADLVRVATREHPHVTFRTGINSNAGWLRSIERPDGFTTYFKEPPPLAVHVRKDCLAVFTGSPCGGVFEQVDHDIVDVVYRQGRLRAIDDSRTFFWGEMSPDNKNVPTIRNMYWSKAARYLHQKPLRWYDRAPIADNG